MWGLGAALQRLDSLHQLFLGLGGLALGRRLVLGGLALLRHPGLGVSFSLGLDLVLIEALWVGLILDGLSLVRRPILGLGLGLWLGLIQIEPLGLLWQLRGLPLVLWVGLKQA